MKNDDPLSGWFDDDAAEDARPAAASANPGGPDWAGIGITGTGRSRRSLAVVSVLAAVAWVGAGIAWALAPGGDAGGPATAEDVALQVPADAETAPSPAPVPGRSSPGLPPDATAEPAPAAAGGGHSRDAAAVIALHELATVDRTDEEGPSRWVDAAAVERWVPLPGDVHATTGADRIDVAVVRALILEGDGSTWDRRRQARYAVPVRCRGQDCAAAAAAWPLPLAAPHVAAATPLPEPSAPAAPSPAASAGVSPPSVLQDARLRALAAAGYTDVELGVARDRAPTVTEVEVVAVPPGGIQAEALHVWLDESSFDGVSGIRVLGMP